jgi:hypothetical protein
LAAEPEVSETLICEFILPGVGAMPSAMARQLGRCHISIVDELAGGRLFSQWTETDHGLEISIALGPEDHRDERHDVTLELLLCLGQAFWTKLNHNQRKA